MGVPSFFRWLSRKYPKIISPVIEDPPQVVDGVTLPLDYSAENPNGELDNLYLDMNGIVHPCSHPENRPPPETEDEMLLAVFEYTNRVLNMARPRKVLVMAVDGVAPRAKMNQQRARRFRSAKDAEIQNAEREREILQRESYGEIIDDSIRNKKTWDSNAITPGTPFMDKLAAALRYWTAFKLATDPGWKNLQVVISDATVPGEGEHKIMNFVRSQRADPEYNPNTTHCIYGLDADLIFLGLATHEPHFKILREDVFAQGNGKPKKNNKNNNTFAPRTEEEKEEISQEEAKKPFLWLHVSVLREYLAAELWVPRLPFTFDLERAIDDWVFMCFFCGNDFLPHLPSLDVRENSIDILLDIWKVVLPQLKTYMTCDGNLNLESVEKLLGQLGAREPDIFKTRHTQEIRKHEAMQRRKQNRNGNLSKGQDRHPTKITEQLQMYDTSGNLAKGSWNLTTHDMVNLKKELMLANEGDKDAIAIIKAQSDKNNELMNNITDEKMDEIVSEANANNRSAADILRKKLMAKKHILEEEEEEQVKEEREEGVMTKKLKTEQDNLKNEIKSEVEAENDEDEDEDEEDEDEDESTDDKETATEIISNGDIQSGIVDTNEAVKLYEPGYIERYYNAKFHIESKDINTVRKGLVKAYIEGVSWVLRYYYQGCASWTWYYPFHYAPFGSDFTNITDIEVKFELGEPFLPFEQLMSVLPAASGHTLPAIFRPLMSDEDSPIIDFYPKDFPVDMNGKKMPWQAIALLPFIDEKRLLETTRAQYPKLTESEKSRNVRNEDILLISNKNVNYENFLKKLYEPEYATNQPLKFGHFKSGLSGIVSTDKEGFNLNDKLICPISEGSLPELSTNLFLKMSFEFNPLVVPNKSLILNGYIPPIQALDSYDLDSIMYKYGKNSYDRNRNRFNDSMRDNIIKTGPNGSTQYKPRAGGYRAFFYFNQQQNNQNGIQYQNSSGVNHQERSGYNRSNNGNNYNRGYHNSNSYNQGNNYNNNGNYSRGNNYNNNGRNNSNNRGGYNNRNNYGNQRGGYNSSYNHSNNSRFNQNNRGGNGRRY